MNGMWKDLSSASRLLWNPSNSCEAELQDLMVQIDKLVQEKKVEWEHDLHIVESKLSSKEKDCQTIQESVDEKNKELTQLKRRLEEAEQIRKSNYAEYESQINYLRKEVLQMSRQYERLQKKHVRQTRELERDKDRVTGEMDEYLSEKKTIESKLENYKRQEWEWDQERSSLQRQLEQVSASKATLEEKYTLMQEQAAGYQCQLDRRKQILDSTEMSLKSQISHLEIQLGKAKNGMTNQSQQLDQLKASLDETVSNYKRVFDEKEQFEVDVRAAKKTILRLEELTGRQTTDLRARDQALLRADQECRAKADELANLKEEGKRTTSKIKSLESLQQARLEKVSCLENVERELQESRATIKQLKRGERRQQEEIETLMRRLEEDEKRRIQLEEELNRHLTQREDSGKISTETESFREEIKRDQVPPSGQKDRRPILLPDAQYPELRIECNKLETRHLEDSSALRRSNLDMEDQVTETKRSEREVRDKLSSVEQRCASTKEESDRQLMELQVANAQLKALRLENRHLRSCITKADETSADETTQAETHLHQLQTAYVAALDQVESEKQKMHEELMQTQKSAESRVHDLAETVSRLETEKRSLSQQIQTQTESLRKVKQENSALTSFMENVTQTLSPNTKVQGCPTTTPRRFVPPMECRGDSTSGQDHTWQVNNHNLGINNQTMNEITQIIDPSLSVLPLSSNSFIGSGNTPVPVSISAEQFLAEEEQRSRDLEAIINSHIEDLKSKSNGNGFNAGPRHQTHQRRSTGLASYQGACNLPSPSN